MDEPNVLLTWLTLLFFLLRHRFCNMFFCDMAFAKCVLPLMIQQFKINIYILQVKKCYNIVAKALNKNKEFTAHTMFFVVSIIKHSPDRLGSICTWKLIRNNNGCTFFWSNQLLVIDQTWQVSVAQCSFCPNSFHILKLQLYCYQSIIQRDGSN